MDASEDGDIPLGLSQGVSLKGGDELRGEESFKSVL